MRPVVTTALTGLLLATVTAPHAAAAAVPEVPVDPDRTVFTDNPRIVDQHPARVESWSRNGEGLRVNFTAGTPQCYGAHVVATETAETVTVELSVGTRPEAADRMCIAIALDATMDVPLQQPLGDRTVVSA